MKKSTKGFVFGIICSALLSSLPVLGANTSSILATLYPQNDNLGLCSNNTYYTSDSIIYNDSTYVPLRSVFNALDCRVDWIADDNLHVVFVNNNYKNFNTNININGVTYTFDSVYHYALDENDIPYVTDIYIDEAIMPLLADCKYDDATVTWYYDSKEAVIK